MKTGKTGTFAALLRGINLGGRNRLPMKDLTAMFVKAGCGHVATYIQSGNVVFQADKALAQKVPEMIPKAILKGFGIQVPVMVRSAAELGAIAAGNPFLRSGANPEALHVGFLSSLPNKAALDSLDPERSPGDEFRVLGDEIYLHCPNGFGRTQLTNQYFDSKLSSVTTIRNWRTVLTLLEMTQGTY